MHQETVGKVISVSKQWWFKINTTPVRIRGTDNAIYPYIIKVLYTVDGRDYTKRKWIRAGNPIPAVGSSVQILHNAHKPSKAQIF